jgi:hypothetical protein
MSEYQLPEQRAAKPCPFCKGTDLKWDYETRYGHGDSGFTNGRIFCVTCTGSKGDISGFGSPTMEIERFAWKQWNTRE